MNLLNELTELQASLARLVAEKKAAECESEGRGDQTLKTWNNGAAFAYENTARDLAHIIRRAEREQEQ